MRALTQGLDERASWDRYLRLEGEHTDLRTVRRTIAWIRDAFAAAARREQKPGTARLILLDPDRFTVAPALPSLAEFAAVKGLEDFSEAEQIEAYEAAYPAGGRGGQGGNKSAGSARPSRRARVIDHQLQALRWLEGLVVQDPRPSDSVMAWLHPSLAARLARAGLPTLVALVERINGIGARWWVQVPGVGERKAGRILDWLHANEAVLGLRVGAHVATPRAQQTPTALASVVPAATALVPFEKFVLPAKLDGSEGATARHRRSALSWRSTTMKPSAPGWPPSGRAMGAGNCRRPSAPIARKRSGCSSGRSSRGRRRCRRCRWRMRAPTAAFSSSRRRAGAGRGTINAGRRCGGRSKGR